MSQVMGIIDDRDALCAGCKTLPPIDQLMGHYHIIHDCSKEFLSCDCSFCIWLRENRVDGVPWKLADAVRQLSVEIAGFADDAGNQNLHLDLIFSETGKHFGETKFEMIANPCMCLRALEYSFDLTKFPQLIIVLPRYEDGIHFWTLPHQKLCR
jgi:hypothetical protein